MRLINYLFILLFIVAAGLQYNDPDPWLWMPIYLFGAYCCFIALKRPLPSPLFWAGMIGYGGYALYLLFQPSGVISWVQEHEAENIAASMQASRPWIEAAREFFGLLILILALLLNRFLPRRA